MHLQRVLPGLVIVALALLHCANALAIAQDTDSNRPRPGEMRFHVVHAHLSGNCAGYFYVSQESVRYTAVVPENYKNHSFEIPRAEITALQQWVLMGQAQNVVEIKTAHATYHFWLLLEHRALGQLECHGRQGGKAHYRDSRSAECA
jgi:hypothetical protein